MKIIRAAERYHLDGGWLSAYWLFSFDHYYDPANMNFGPLRVFNHDWIAGGGGFPTHPHREMEIVTYVLEGELAHRDSTGGDGLIHAGEVQRMTAGTGIAHSELNAHPTNPVRLLQMWVQPAQAGLKPSYEQRQFTIAERSGRLLPIATGADMPSADLKDAVRINQDATFYVSRLAAGERVELTLAPGRRAFLYVIEGEIGLNDEVLVTGDQARIVNPSRPLPLELSGRSTGEIILIDLP